MGTIGPKCHGARDAGTLQNEPTQPWCLMLLIRLHVYCSIITLGICKGIFSYITGGLIKQAAV